MELLWDLLRELGILKKKKSDEPKRSEPPPGEGPPADPAEARKRAIEKEDPEALARALKRMMKDK